MEDRRKADPVNYVFAAMIAIVLLFLGTAFYVNWDRWVLVQAVKAGHITWDMEMTAHINLVCGENAVQEEELTFLGISPRDGEDWVYFKTPVDGNCNRSIEPQVWRRPLNMFDKQ